jgi:pyruvate dehydrogenase E2 component (dihydrolipoamide acetyltransferase)
MSAFLMPSLGADMEAGTLVAWRVKPGDTVHRGDVVAEVDTDKGVIEIECFETGVVESLAVAPGTTVPVGTLLATIRASEAPAAAVPAPPPPAAATPGPAGAATLAAPTQPVASAPPPQPSRTALPPPPPTAARARVSPLARARAQAGGLDLATVQGTGPGGAIQVADVERALAAGRPAPPAPAAPPAPSATAATPAPSVTPPPAAVSTAPVAPRDVEDGLAGMRRAIAAAMTRSNREIPHYYLQARIDMTAALAWLRRENESRPVTERLLPVVVLLKAVAGALGDVPELNGHWVDGALRRADRVHLGFAVALRGGGLVAPAIHDVDRLTPGEVMRVLQDLIPRARAGRLRSSEMTDATLTVTSLGDRGVETVFGVIYPPQVALVGFGRIAEQPWAEDGMVGARPVVTASLAGDHRATDGATGARFLEALDQRLRRPEAS